MNHPTLFASLPAPAQLDHKWDATVEAFRWLLILGFPASMAAARLMPDLFSDAVEDAVQFARRVSRNPFGHMT